MTGSLPLRVLASVRLGIAELSQGTTTTRPCSDARDARFAMAKGGVCRVSRRAIESRPRRSPVVTLRRLSQTAR